ncbi:MAG: hypothetical protein AAB490_00895 [Patescibacteria group bacterium]
MDLKDFKNFDNLDRYTFLWSQARLLLGALALLLGGIPPVLFLVRVPALFAVVAPLLKLAWIISGVASAYLLYRWHAKKKVVFGGTAQKDTVAFFVSVVTGLNLGVTGLFGTNIGMSITSSKIIFVVVAILYLMAASHLFMRWKSVSGKIF